MIAIHKTGHVCGTSMTSIIRIVTRGTNDITGVAIIIAIQNKLRQNWIISLLLL
jgi:hypothetical protein